MAGHDGQTACTFGNYSPLITGEASPQLSARFRRGRRRWFATSQHRRLNSWARPRRIQANLQAGCELCLVVYKASRKHGQPNGRVRVQVWKTRPTRSKSSGVVRYALHALQSYDIASDIYKDHGDSASSQAPVRRWHRI